MMHLSDDILQASPFRAFLADLARLGVTPVTEGGLTYAVIAARSNLRWCLLPLGNRRAAAAGLEMLQPVTRAAKTAKKVARLMARFGPHPFLGMDKVRLSGLPDLSEAFGSETVHVAYFTGTDGPHRKTAMQVMDADGAILGYGKASRNKHIRPYIRNEAEMLARVAALGLATVDLPRVLALRDDANLTLLVTNSLKNADTIVLRQLDAKHLRWLDELRTRTGQIGADLLLEALDTQRAQLAPLAGKEWSDRLTRALVVLSPVAADIPLCLAHGDFTPWNSFVQGDQLYVFDWEYANLAWPVGFDLVHFMLAIIPPNQQLRELPRVLKRLASAQFDANEEAARRALLLSLVCHAMFYLGRLQEAGSPRENWADGAVRAALIDLLLNHEATS